MKAARNIIFAVILALVATSCASTGKLTSSGADADFISNYYKLLYAEAMAVDATMTTIGTLYKVGKFSEANKDKAIIAHAQFKLAWDDAVAKLILYYNSPNDASKSEANNACINVHVQAAVITAISIIAAK